MAATKKKKETVEQFLNTLSYGDLFIQKNPWNEKSHMRHCPRLIPRSKDSS